MVENQKSCQLVSVESIFILTSVVGFITYILIFLAEIRVAGKCNAGILRGWRSGYLRGKEVFHGYSKGENCS
jgi:hypothetical protein